MNNGGTGRLTFRFRRMLLTSLGVHCIHRVPNYGEVTPYARFRMHQCVVDKLHIDGTTVYGQQDLTNSEISEISLDGVSVHGYLTFNENKIGSYKNRDTVRLLKNEALKVNDKVNAIHLYAEEMKMLLKDKKALTRAERIPLMINGVYQFTVGFRKYGRK